MGHMGWSRGIGTMSRLYDIITSIVREVFPRQPYAFLYRYRIAEHSGSRYRIQPITANAPKLMEIQALPGVSGIEAKLAIGSQVLISFIEGDPSMPVITHYTAPDEPGWKPISLLLDAQTTIKLGTSAILGVARLGDMAGPYVITSASMKVLSE